MVGIDAASDGLAKAREHGRQDHAPTASTGLLPHVAADNVQIAFDATQRLRASARTRGSSQARGVVVVDLTPARDRPVLRAAGEPRRSTSGKREMNVNMVSCGGQATIPIVAAVARGAAGQLRARSSPRSPRKSAGPGTRKNIDEFTRTTASGIERVGGAKRGKAIIILNPAEPPLIMRDTVHCLTEDAPGRGGASRPRSHAMIAEVQKYVPGYTPQERPGVRRQPRVRSISRSQGSGDYLPEYAGNLDIMTAAALRTAEMIAEEITSGRFVHSRRGLRRGDAHEPARARRSRCTTCACATACTRSATRSASTQMVAVRQRSDAAGVPLIEVTHGDGPRRRLGQLRLPGAQRRGLPACRDPEAQAREGLRAAAARHRHCRAPGSRLTTAASATDPRRDPLHRGRRLRAAHRALAQARPRHGRASSMMAHMVDAR